MFDPTRTLERAFAEAGTDVATALAGFENARRPVVEKIVEAANTSSFWYEDMARAMRAPPWRLAYDYMTRSGRMDEARLREQAPKFMAWIDGQRGGGG